MRLQAVASLVRRGGIQLPAVHPVAASTAVEAVATMAAVAVVAAVASMEVEAAVEVEVFTAAVVAAAIARDSRSLAGSDIL